MSATYSPLVGTGPGNNGAAVDVPSYTLMLVSLSFAITRVFTTVRRNRMFSYDDLTYLIGTVSGLRQSSPQTILIGKAVDHGLGQHMSELTASQLSGYYKWDYAGQIMGVVVQTFAKVSVALLIQRLDSKASTYRTCQIVIGIVLCWFLFSVFAIAFQCGMPSPWIFTFEKCAAGGKLWYPIIVFNILTDAILALFFLPVIWKLQMSRSQRATVASLFGIRIVVCGVSVASLVVLGPYLHSADKTCTSLLLRFHIFASLLLRF